MDSFGGGLLVLAFFMWFIIIFEPLRALILHKSLKALFIIIPVTFLYISYAYVILSGTHNPGCVTWHAVGTGAELVEDKNYYGGRWRNSEHWEHQIGYVPEYCECITYHWPWGDENNFTSDSVIKGQFKGPTVKPEKLKELREEEEAEEEDEFETMFEEEYSEGGVHVKTTIRYR